MIEVTIFVFFGAYSFYCIWSQSHITMKAKAGAI